MDGVLDTDVFYDEPFYIWITARVRFLWNACAVRRIKLTLPSKNCSCAASAERLCRMFDVIRVIFQLLLVYGLCGTPVQNVRFNTRYISTTARVGPLWNACHSI
jgi:hypothetical protein